MSGSLSAPLIWFPVMALSFSFFCRASVSGEPDYAATASRGYLRFDLVQPEAYNSGAYTRRCMSIDSAVYHISSIYALQAIVNSS